MPVCENCYCLNLIGRDNVNFLEDALADNVAEEIRHKDGANMTTIIERAFLLAYIQSSMAGIMTSGATVAICIVNIG